MRQVARKLFPYLALLLLVSALLWAISFDRLPKADFTFNNGDRIKTIDPARATGSPEGRIINAVFEGLLRMTPVGEPDDDGNVLMKPMPAMAESLPKISEDGKTYTFTIRQSVRWSDDTPVTAHDFVWSWQRFIHPETASEYAKQLYYVRGAEDYNKSKFEVGNRVEVELPNRPDEAQLFPRGTILRGVLRIIIKPPEPEIADDASKDKKDEAKAKHKRRWTCVVEVKGKNDETIDWDKPGELRAFSIEPVPDKAPYDGEIKKCRRILVNFETEVGIHAPNDRTLVVQLKNPTYFFNELVAFYPLYPVNRLCVETHGVPQWTKPKNIVGNGPFTVEFRRIRDRIRLRKNPLYWNADIVQLETIDAFAIKKETTSLNMYLDDRIDWSTTVPNALIPELLKRDDFITAPAMIAYFYRFNVDKEPFNKILVRRALSMAIDKKMICEKITQAGETPTYTFAPAVLSGLPPKGTGYESPQFKDMKFHDVSRVRQLLKKAKEEGKDNDDAYIKQRMADVGYIGTDRYVDELLRRARASQEDDDYPGINWMKYDVEGARKLLALAGHPNGRGMPRFSILYNSSEAHRAIAEVIQQQWNKIGVEVELKNAEWGTYLSAVSQKQYEVARAGWIGDYFDPFTYIDMFVEDGTHNNTNWSNPRYDEIINRLAPQESNPAIRMELIKEAEAILLAEQPIVPIYFYVSKNMVKPHVRGFFPNIQDIHPLHLIRIEEPTEP